MTEIKLRAWSRNLKQMFYSEPAENDESRQYHPFVFQIGTKTANNHNDFDLMLFTGRKDKIGKDIYVGDIFGSTALRCVVEKMGDGAFVLSFIDIRIMPISILDPKVEISEVIGNIYEHPHLLNPSKVG